MPKRIAVIVALLLAAASFAGQSPVGQWKGKVVEMIPTTNSTNLQVAKMIAAMKAISVDLKINADKSFSTVPDGGPGKGKMQIGTWTQAGNTITFKPKSSAASKLQGVTQSMSLSADGKTLTMKLPPGGGFTGKAIFTRR